MKKQKSFLASNLKYLRERRKKTQTEIAETLKVTRAKINAYENEVNVNPTVDDLSKFTNFFKISIDSLLWVNLKRLTELQLRNLEAGNDEFIMGTKIRVLATTVDSQNRENIEIVPIKAKAGYANGYGNPEFIERLQSFQFPILSENRKFRMFQIEGDSMLPIPDKSFVIGEFIENWKGIESGKAHIVITKNDGIVFKILTPNIIDKNKLVFHSLNPNYKDFELGFEEINEVWKFSYYLSSELPSNAMKLGDMDGLVIDFKKGLLKFIG
jgi:transcriptional regulator with XRE-family HTH domain